jgi:hypothetical protein
VAVLPQARIKLHLKHEGVGRSALLVHEDVRAAEADDVTMLKLDLTPCK